MEAASPFPLQELDHACIERYRDFLPERIFDAHMHVYPAGGVPSFSGSEVFSAPAVSAEDYLRDMQRLLPGVRSLRMNCIPMPDPALTQIENGLRGAVNRYAAQTAAASPGCCASTYILPKDSADTITVFLQAASVRALKCYAYGAGIADIESLPVQAFLPESAWEIANAQRLPIILHLMHPAALSAPDNFAYICKMTARYPDAQLVLAHCARGFASWTVVQQIARLADNGNIWFDLSAICESGPMLACLMKNSCKRTIWGSDYPICMHHGRAISLAGGQTWLTGEAFSALPRTYIAVENLQALHEAALLLDLDQTQLEDIFYRNALRLFRL